MFTVSNLRVCLTGGREGPGGGGKFMMPVAAAMRQRSPIGAPISSGRKAANANLHWSTNQLCDWEAATARQPGHPTISCATGTPDDQLCNWDA